MSEAAFALAGVLVGFAVRGVIEHRRWLRDVRLKTYAAFLHAWGEASGKAANYMNLTWVMLERIKLGEQPTQELLERFDAAYEAFKSALLALSREAAEVELVGSWNVHIAAQFASHKVSSFATPYYFGTDLFEPERPQKDVDSWRESGSDRRSACDRFVKASREDLRTDPWKAGRAARRRWNTWRANIRGWWRKRRDP